MYEIFTLSELETSDYQSYVFRMKIGDFISNSHSSDVQRIRNENKELGIMHFIEKHLDNGTSPFFQPFILHYSGNDILERGSKLYLDPKPNFDAIVTTEYGEDIKSFFFEVIDGNGRLNSMIRLNAKLKEEIAMLQDKMTKTEDARKANNLKQKLFNTRSKLTALNNTVLVMQLYLNLPSNKKEELFHSVNQGEAMAQGRLKIYDKSSVENTLLHNYIKHTEGIDFPYTITPDKDSLRSDFEKEHFIPTVYILPLLKKLVRYYGEDVEIQYYQDEIFDILDSYIIAAKPNAKPFLRKQYFSIIGTIVDKASKYEGDLKDHILKILEFDYTQYGEVSKALKAVRTAVTEFVFDGAKEVKCVEA